MKFNKIIKAFFKGLLIGGLISLLLPVYTYCTNNSFTISGARLTTDNNIIINIKSADLLVESSSVIMVTTYNKKPIYDEGCIVYFNTINITANEYGNAEIEISPASWLGTDYRAYAIILCSESGTKNIFILDLDNLDTPIIFYGDVNGDGVADAIDAELILTYVLTGSTDGFVEDGLIRADATNDGSIDATDSAAVISKLF